MQKNKPIIDLTCAKDISDICNTDLEPVSKSMIDYGELEVMSIGTYEQMVETKAIDDAITEAEAEIAAGASLIDVKEAFDSLRKKYFG